MNKSKYLSIILGRQCLSKTHFILKFYISKQIYTELSDLF
jgi:hypothetical protein